MSSLKVENCLKKKNPPRAQIFRYFRIESRNNNYCLNSLILSFSMLIKNDVFSSVQFFIFFFLPQKMGID